jgi:four helix bundle protein
MSEYARTFRELDVYRQAFQSAMTIFDRTKAFPAEERYGIVDQMRRSSRSVCATIAEAWRKRDYLAAFRSKLADAMQEAAETQCWLDFCRACGYLDEQTFQTLDREYEGILGKLNSMHQQAESFCFQK